MNNLDITDNFFEKQNKKNNKNINRSAIAKSARCKGKTGERYIADFLAKVTGMPFIRVPNSGAFVGSSNRSRMDNITSGMASLQLGDIISPEFLTHQFIWESKNYADLDFHNLFYKENSKQLLGWLSEVEYDAESYILFNEKKQSEASKINENIKLSPKPFMYFLVVKITRKGTYIIFDYNYYKETFGCEPLVNNYLIFNKLDSPPKLKDSGCSGKYILTSFEEFIENNHINIFKVMV